jgi:polyisoprenoid-binding protein YceI
MQIITNNTIKMKNLIIAATLAVSAATTASAQLYKSVDKSVNVSFFSETPMENIDAKSSVSTSIINFATDSIIVKIPVKAFMFKNSLMGEHFNENYMESEKYPYSIFRGKIDTKIDVNKNTVNKVKAMGKATIHGVTNPCTLEGTITVKDGELLLVSSMDVVLADYKVEIPKLVGDKIAKIIKVKVDANYLPYAKKK